MRTAVVIIASTRAAAGIYPDRTGPLIAEWLIARGFQVTGPQVMADGPEVERVLREAVGADILITSGGTGISPTDRTPQATAAVLDYEIPGLAAAIRHQGSDAVPTAVLSRGLAGVAGRTLVVNLPGSTGGVSDGLAVLDRVLEHALDQISGGDHQAHQTPHHQHSSEQRPFGHDDAPATSAAPGHHHSGHHHSGHRHSGYPSSGHTSSGHASFGHEPASGSAALPDRLEHLPATGREHEPEHTGSEHRQSEHQSTSGGEPESPDVHAAGQSPSGPSHATGDPDAARDGEGEVAP